MDKVGKYLFDNIDASIVWVIVKRHLPVLKEEVNQLIEK
jgi:uncharacterized protein with HEPN domain